MNDATGARLTLRSNATGETNGFRIDASGGLTDLGYDPRVGVTSLILVLAVMNGATAKLASSVAPVLEDKGCEEGAEDGEGEGTVVMAMQCSGTFRKSPAS